MSRRRPPRAASPNTGHRNFHGSHRSVPSVGSGATHRKPEEAPGDCARKAYFTDIAADFDGSATADLVRTVGLLVATCGSEEKLAVLAKELAANVERRDARNIIEQLYWRLDMVSGMHAFFLEPGARRGS